MAKVTTYKMNKTLKEAAKGGEVDALSFVDAVNEKKERLERRNQAFRKTIKRTYGLIKDEEERSKDFRDSLEKRVKFCPECGYATFIENHNLLCVRKCRRCEWKSKPWRRVEGAFSL